MKNEIATSFISGFILCLILVMSFGFGIVKQTTQPEPNVFQVVNEQANTYRANYQANFPNDLQGMNISYSQWQAIEQVISEMSENPNEIAGFRLYHGLKTNSRNSARVSCVYKLTRDFSEPVTGSTGSSNMVTIANNVPENFTDQCPPFCD